MLVQIINNINTIIIIKCIYLILVIKYNNKVGAQFLFCGNYRISCIAGTIVINALIILNLLIITRWYGIHGNTEISTNMDSKAPINHNNNNIKLMITQ